MILYLTKQTFERYKLTPPEKMHSPVREITEEVKKREQGNRLLEWGGKILYFDRRKCIQFTNFASKFTVFLIDIKVKDLQDLGDAIFMYLFDFYQGNREMTNLLKRLAEEHPITVIDRLKDKSVIATLNRTQLDFALDGYRFYEFIENNVLQSKKLNRKVNTDYIFGKKVDGKSSPEYFFSGTLFEKLLKEYYGKA